MPKKLKYKRTTEELEAIRRAMKSRNAKVAQRATMLNALHLGDTPRQIATRQAVSVATVYSVFNCYLEEGITGLTPRPKSGRPRLLTEAHCKQLEDVLERDPRELGYGFTIWTGRRLQVYLRDELNIEVSEGTLRNTLKRMGYVFRRPKKSLAHVQNADEVETFKELLAELKKEHKTVILGSSLWIKPD